MRNFTWADLRSIGNSKAVQASPAFPFVGYLILFNDEVARFLSMKALEASGASGLSDVLWALKLYFVYFGLMALGIGSGIYQIYCPFIVKKHGDWMDYVRIDGDSLSNAAATSIGATLGHVYERDIDTEEPDQVTIDYMREWYELQSHEMPGWRRVVSLLFAAGLLLLAVPSVLSATKIGVLFLSRLGPLI